VHSTQRAQDENKKEGPPMSVKGSVTASVGGIWAAILAFSGAAIAADPLDVVINEVAWMGTQFSDADEWIELYNNTSSAINLTGWVIVSTTDSTPNFTINSTNCSNVTIPANGFFLLERTDDTSVSDISADCIYTGSLLNSGEALALKDPSNNVIDTANGNGGPWPAGAAPSSNPAGRATMERKISSQADSDTNWCTNNGLTRNGLDAGNNPINGTPQAQNSCALVPANPLDVVISEVAWMGTSASASDEWIELYNNTNQTISLTGWTLSDGGDINIMLSGTIPANGFFLLERTDDTTVSDITADQLYSGTLSNSGETLTLKDSLGNVIDTANGNGGAWPAGDESTRSTMERIDLASADSDTNWAINDGIHRNGLDAHNHPINGTPKAQNSAAFAPAVNITSPTSASALFVKPGDSFNVSFSSNKPGTYTIKVDGTSCGSGAAGVGSNTKVCTLPGVFAEGTKDLSVEVTDSSSNTGTDTETGAIRVDNTGPSVTVTSPNGGEVVLVPSTINIKWVRCADAGSGVAPNSVKIEYASDGGASWNLIAMNEANDGNFTWSVPGILDSHQMLIRITCADNVGNLGSDVSDNLFVATLGPIATKENRNLLTSSLLNFLPGDFILYTITLINPSAAVTLHNAQLIDPISDPALVAQEQPSTATASSGVITYNRRTKTYTWTGSLPPLGTVTITLKVRIKLPVRSRVCNQGIFKADYNGDGSLETTVLTSDPTPVPGAGSQTCADVTLRPSQKLAVTGPLALWLPGRRTFYFEVLGIGIQEISVEIFSLGSERVYTSGWVLNGFEWELLNQGGRRVAHGVYLYVMSARGYNSKLIRLQARKLVNNNY
jgi:hypothetical protein